MNSIRLQKKQAFCSTVFGQRESDIFTLEITFNTILQSQRKVGHQTNKITDFVFLIFC